MATPLNQAQIEVLVSFLISQGQTRVRALELIQENPGAVQAQMDAAASSTPHH